MNDKYNEVKKIVAELDENYYLKLDAVIDEHINGEIHEIRKIINAEDFNYNKRFFKVNPSDTNTVLASANSGFYMIFTDYEYNEFVKKIDEENNINQTGQLHNQPLYLNVAELSLYCVYRGHSSNTKNRIQSHFYDMHAKDYPNTMIVNSLQDEEQGYQLLFNIGKWFNVITREQSEICSKIIDASWYVVTIPLNDSDLKLRANYEQRYDNLYLRPRFSREKSGPQ